MHSPSDSYKTIAQPSTVVLFKDRKSKFYGQAFPLETLEEVKPILESLRKQYPSANHFCYAWQMGIGKPHYRANDDGEPKNSAGMPIYGQIQSFEVTNILLVVVRVFGGAKLGVSGLINAYRTASQMALETAVIEERLIQTILELQFQYDRMNEVMRTLKRCKVQIISQKMEIQCLLKIAVPRSETEKVRQGLEKIRHLNIAIL